MWGAGIAPRVSDDKPGAGGQTLHDVDEHGTRHHGLEDAAGCSACRLKNARDHHREGAERHARHHLPSAQLRVQLAQFGWHVLTNYVVRNADCHAKTSALSYTPDSAT